LPAAKEAPAIAEKSEHAAREGEDKKVAKTENHPKKQNESPPQQAEEKTVEHPLTQLLKSKKYFALALAFFVGVVVAPIAEEFLFRLLLIGWLEKAETQWREQWQLRSLVIPLSALPILASSLLFASMHFRTASDKLEESNLVFTLAISAIMNLLVVSFAIVLIRMRTGATARDFGWDSRRFFKDIGLGVFSFFLVAVPIFFLQMVLLTYLPKQFAPDPIPLFFFAVVLGLLYQRTHRLVPSIVLHALLNFCSLAVFWFQ
jgi:membrane protease YdiL (CAAX protease family)